MSVEPDEGSFEQLTSRLARRERELDAVRRISQALFQHTNVDAVVERALHTALELIGAESGSVIIAVPESQQLVFRYSIGQKPVARGKAIPWQQGIAGAVFQSGLSEIIDNVKEDRRHFSGIDAETGYVTRNMIALPLKRWEGDAIGVLEVLNKREGRFDADDLAILTTLSALTAIAIEQARLFQEAKLAEVARLLGDIGHDVQNMLTPVVMGTKLLHGDLEDLFQTLPRIEETKARTSRKQCTEVLEMLQSVTGRLQRRMKEIVDCVAGLSKPPEFMPCDLNGVVEAVFKTLHVLAQSRGVSLQASGLDGLPTILADDHRLFNAIYNLVNNAIPEVAPGGTVSVSGRTESGFILLSVADTGRGMPPEVRESLFTARAITRKEGGTGLGTKIVKDVVDAHGGQISVESELGRGTVFHLRLPLKQPGGALRS